LKYTVSFNIPPILVVVVGLRVSHHPYHVTIIRKIVILSNKFKGRKSRHEIGRPSGGMNKRFVSSRAKTYPLFTPLEIIPRCSATGLDCRIIPARFNAPLEFLTGFILLK
jgi:hypothetical protein